MYVFLLIILYFTKFNNEIFFIEMLLWICNVFISFTDSGFIFYTCFIYKFIPFPRGHSLLQMFYLQCKIILLYSKWCLCCIKLFSTRNVEKCLHSLFFNMYLLNYRVLRYLSPPIHSPNQKSHNIIKHIVGK